MKQFENQKAQFERELERAWQNIEDIHIISHNLRLNLAKSRALRHEAVKFQMPANNVNESAAEF